MKKDWKDKLVQSWEPNFVVSSGSYKLDFSPALNAYNGIPAGSIVQYMSHKEGSFKTTLALAGGREMQKKTGKKLAFIDAEGGLTGIDWVKAIGVDTSTDMWTLALPDTGEEAFDMADYFIENEEYGGVIIDSIDACLSSDTEILTNRGWLKYNEIKENEKIATFDKKDNSIEYQTIKRKIVKKENTDNLINIKNNVLDILVTKDHRMIYRPCSYKTKEISWNTKQAQEIYNKKYFIPTAGKHKPITNSYDINLLKLGVFAIADGNYEIRNNKIHSVKFHLTKDRKKTLLKNILINGNFDFKISLCGNYYKIYGNLARKIYNLFPDKELEWTLLQSSKQEKLAILDIYRQTDGTTRKKGYTLFSSNRKNIDILQALCLNVNKTASISTIKSNDRKTTYKLFVINKNYRTVKKPDSNYLPYNGTDTVWCVTVPNGYIIARRNDKSFIVGNCTPEKNLESEYGDANIGNHAKLVTGAIRKWKTSVRNNQTILWLVNQMKVNITNMGARGHTATGGKGLGFYCKLNMEMGRGLADSSLKDDIHIPLTFKVKRSKLGQSFLDIDTYAIQGTGIDTDSELRDFAEQSGILIKAGSWWRLNDGKTKKDQTVLGQGSEACRVWVRENKDALIRLMKTGEIDDTLQNIQ
jgi:RecA/RadA recombinase